MNACLGHNAFNKLLFIFFLFGFFQQRFLETEHNRGDAIVCSFRVTCESISPLYYHGLACILWVLCVYQSWNPIRWTVSMKTHIHRLSTTVSTFGNSRPSWNDSRISEGQSGSGERHTFSGWPRNCKCKRPLRSKNMLTVNHSNFD